MPQRSQQDFIFLDQPFASMINGENQGEGAHSAAFERASRHSRLVRLLKFVLPVCALAILAGFALVAIQARMVPQVDVAGVALQNGKIVMESPKLNGMTGDNRPYTVEAIRALQSVSDVNDIELEGIIAAIPFGSGQTANVQAPVGHLDNTKQVLNLKGGFDLTTSDGMVAKLQDAVFDFAIQSLKTDKPVDIKRPGTHLRANSMSITNGGAVLVFEKQVRMTFLPDNIGQTEEPKNGG
jgi:lipopolysaccharide export system protein LptC